MLQNSSCFRRSRRVGYWIVRFRYCLLWCVALFNKLTCSEALFKISFISFYSNVSFSPRNSEWLLTHSEIAKKWSNKLNAIWILTFTKYCFCNSWFLSVCSLTPILGLPFKLHSERASTIVILDQTLLRESIRDDPPMSLVDWTWKKFLDLLFPKQKPADI